jgi:hypothetical protein
VPPYLAGFFVVLAGVAMLIGRKPMALMQYSALEQARIAGNNRDRALTRLQRIIVIGSIAFIILGLYWVFNPLSD